MSIALIDLPAKALQELRVIGGDQAPSAGDHTFVLEQYQWLRNELERDWNITWDVDDDIPDGAEKAVVLLLANFVAVAFAKAWSPERQKMGEDRIRLAVRELPSLDPPQDVDYF